MSEKTECIRILFEVPKNGYNACHDKALIISFLENKLTFSIFYDFNDKPLELTAYAEPGDCAEIVMLPYRIELYINSSLCDEEWQCGKCLYTPENENLGGLEISVRKNNYTEKESSAVIGEFEFAEGWRPSENVFVGDCMPYVDEGRYHVLYLKDRHHHCSKWGLGAHQWAHISTSDFQKWQIHPMAVEITDPSEASVCTGSWIKHGGKHYLFYAIRTVDGSPAIMKRSISDDGYHFEKDSGFSFTLSEKYHQGSARDPKVIRGNDGLFHMLITTSLADTDNGCIAHLISKDLDIWNEALEPIYVSSDSSQPECPDYIEFKKKYYLIFSPHIKAQYLYSDKPFSDWKEPSDPIIPCYSVPKGAVWNGKIVFTGFKSVNGYAGNITFKTADADENGNLLFE